MSKFAFFGFRFLEESISLWFQSICHVCGELCGSRSLCAKCEWGALSQKVIPPLCERCGETLSQSLDRCGRCLGNGTSINAARSLLWLGEGSRVLLHKVKYGKRFELLTLWREVFKRSFGPFFPKQTVVMPVPLHRSRFQQRGFNQAEILASWVAVETGLDLELQALSKTRRSIAQSSLSRRERFLNLKSHFAWDTRRSVPRSALLVDDVYTTGATLQACAKVLKKAGCEEVYAWTLFRTPRI